MTTFTDRFWAKVDKRGPDECWLWRAAVDKDGYGWQQYRDRLRKAHQVAYELTNGPYAEGLAVLHRCDCRPCCNPRHLFLGTNEENTADRHAKGRDARGEGHGMSKLTAEQVLAIRGATGTATDIGRRFGIHRKQVTNIKRREQWAHLP